LTHADFSVSPSDLAYYNPDTKQWEIEKGAYKIYVGNSSDEKSLITQTFTIR